MKGKRAIREMVLTGDEIFLLECKELKQCERCGYIKQYPEFRKSDTERSGREGYCDVCMIHVKREKEKEGRKVKREQRRADTIELLGDGKKRCTFCQAVKPVHKFFKNKRAKDGLLQYCKKCSSVRRRRHYMLFGTHD